MISSNSMADSSKHGNVLHKSGNPFQFAWYVIKNTFFPTNNIFTRSRLLKRVSPFLLLSIASPVLFLYMFITGNGAIHSEWLLLLLFPFCLVNLLFADFAIWNYFAGKKRFKIWMIELAFSILIIYFFK